MLVVLEAQKFRRDCKKRPGTSRMIYQGTSIRRGPSFAIALLQKAEAFCWHYLAGSRCFLVKDDTLCTVWIQTSEALHLQPSEQTIRAKQDLPARELGGVELAYRGHKYVKKMALPKTPLPPDKTTDLGQSRPLRSYRGVQY
ncbi:MAG: hypothetical protein AAF152_03305 [Cyanobacteria bacterium P01_A01_bin.114]